ncbi:MAG TPA: antibiotic biosynthesis monooxygenase [Terriglobia bacterium]|nr:antibiotic biosynthesis monooxygenase [Terriglobia bacterium]
MIVLLVHAHVKPEFVEAFRLAIVENAQHSIQEPGVARFDILQQQDDPTRFVFVEAYRTQEAVEAHRKSAHYAKWCEAVEKQSMLAEPRTRAFYTNAFPPDQGW